jgi:chorismate dehydratase
MARYSVSVVNYLNSAPFVTGLELAAGLELEMHLDVPSDSARKLASGKVDIALAPVAVIPRIPNPHIISDYCIGCDGPVRTVQLFSEVPVNEIKRIYLDYQSETSVRLTGILCREHWKIEPEMVRAYPGFQKDIFGHNAGLIIGDRAIRVLGRYPFETDLGEAWKQMTGLPFVFAVWLANREIDPAWQASFSAALGKGLARRDEVIRKYSHMDKTGFSVEEYLMNNIDYDLNKGKRQALERYLSMISRL